LVVLADSEIVKSPGMKRAGLAAGGTTSCHFVPANTHSRPMIDGAQCSKVLYLPEWSEYCDKNSVRHLGNAKHAIMPLKRPFAMKWAAAETRPPAHFADFDSYTVWLRQ
jgi:hypothetical protein